jgi:peptidylprolyl isomerase
MRSRAIGVFVGVLLAALLTGASSAFAQEVVARIGNQELNLNDLKRLVDAQSPELRKQIATDLGALEQLVRRELVRQAVLAEARREGWDKRPEVQLQMERAREQALLQSYMGSLVRAPATYPSEEEIKAFYEANRASLVTPTEYDLAQIFIASPQTADRTVAAAAQKKAVEIATRLQKAPADFAKVAQEGSDHKETAAKGGALGWVPETQLIAEVRAVASRLNKGEVSTPIRSSAGWHVIRVLDRRPGTVRSLADAREQISQAMRLRKAQEGERAYLDNLLKQSQIVVNQVELQKFQTSIR